MSSSNKHVVFDVVGTCISYDNFFEAIESRFGERFKERSIGSRLFGYAWMEASEKEYTYLSIAGRYVKFWDFFRATFYRTLSQAGIEEPEKFATDEDREYLLDAYMQLKARPGLAECFSKLRNAGFTVWAFTSGDTSRVAGYLSRGGVEMPSENFVSCDTIKIGKPAPESYQHILDKLPKDGRETWFAAAHLWDLAGAKGCGFKCAWSAEWEKDACGGIFGEMEVTAKDLPSLADGIIAYSTEHSS